MTEQENYMSSLSAQDLRIGNIVCQCGWYVKVIGILEDSSIAVKRDSTKMTTNIANFRPIKLTEAFFKNNGFIKQNDFEDVLYYRSEDMRMQVYENYLGWVVNIDNENFTMVFSNNLKYVHELQNAYYVSTGEELEVNL